jgi:uncharacterized protein YprB with RNaseH-like and TPR domain
MSRPRKNVLVFDIETTNLDANRGHIICAAAKWYGNPELFKFRIDSEPGYGKTPASFYDDAHIVRGLVSLADGAEAVVAYYGAYGRFDVPYVNTRAVISGQRPFPSLTIIDPYDVARSRLKLARNNLDSVSEALGTRRRKTHLPWADWLAAQYGDRKAIDTLLKYNVNDVLLLEEVYDNCLPLMPNHPYIGEVGQGEVVNERCPVSAYHKTVVDGTRRTKSYIVHRRRCKTCGTCFVGHRTKIR